MDGCIYRTKDGECDLYAENGKYKAWCEMDGCDGRKMSNADRIRAMTDEELAEFIAEVRNAITCVISDEDSCRNPDEPCQKCWLRWLNQEEADG